MQVSNKRPDKEGSIGLQGQVSEIERERDESKPFQKATVIHSTKCVH